MDRMSAYKPHRGLTLLECLVVLLVIAVVVVVASPGFAGAIERVRLSAEAERMLVALNLARTEAVQANAVVSLCPSPMANTGAAECDGDYAGGWIVFHNPGRDASPGGDGSRVIRVFGRLRQGYTLTNRTGTRNADRMISYLPDGTSHSNRTLKFCSPGFSTDHSLSVVVNIVGRARLERSALPCSVA